MISYFETGEIAYGKFSDTGEWTECEITSPMRRHKKIGFGHCVKVEGLKTGHPKNWMFANLKSLRKMPHKDRTVAWDDCVWKPEVLRTYE